MSFVTRLISLLALLVLSACGGGGGDLAPFGSGASSPGGGNGGGGGTVAVADLDVQLSAPTIANTGVGTVTATITALDANRNAVRGAAVNVAADAGAILTIQGSLGSVTDATGRIVATVGVGSDRSNRDITITATAGGIARSAVLKVVNSPAGAVPTTIEIIAGATTAGTGGDGVQIRAFVKDANNNALPGASVAFSTNTGTLSAVSTVTDSSGVASATFSAGADKTNRTAVIKVDSGTVSSQLSLPVSGTKLTLSGPSSLIRGASATFDIVVTDSRSNVVPGVTVTAVSSLGNAVAATGGNTTNSNGQVSFSYTATNPGTDTLTFSGAGATVSPAPALAISGQTFSFVSPAPSATVNVDATQVLRVRLQGVTPMAGNVINFAATGGTLSASSATTDAAGEATVSIKSASAGPITVQATVAGGGATTTLPLVVIATVPSRLVLQVTPTALPPNATASTSNQAQVVAKVTDPVGNPVQGLTVNFTRLSDPSGGNLLQASATTDASGQASVAYRSGAESTANNGVVLSASVASAPTVSATATLTVNQTALFIALGTGNDIDNPKPDPQTYKKDWVVYVTDANGIAVNGATLTIKAIPTHYLTGRLAWNGVSYAYQSPIYACRNEDADTDGILDPGEDDNVDGVLWPGNVIAVSPSTVQTVNGRATISLTYAESFAPWVQLRLTASATVTGTESRTDVEFIVGGSSPDFTEQVNPPAGLVSPFGTTFKPGAACTLFQ